MFIVLLGFIHADRESGAGHYSFINMVYWRHVSYNRHREIRLGSVVRIRIRNSPLRIRSQTLTLYATVQVKEEYHKKRHLGHKNNADRLQAVNYRPVTQRYMKKNIIWFKWQIGHKEQCICLYAQDSDPCFGSGSAIHLCGSGPIPVAQWDM